MIGIDLVHVPEFQKQLQQGGAAFMNKAFHEGEANSDQPDHLAGLWAAKEAVLKALDLTVADWADIVLSHAPSGRPLATYKDQKVEISIAHHGDYAVAVAQKVSS